MKKIPLPLVSKFIIAFVVPVLLLTWSISHGLELDSQTLRYSVKYANHNAGEIEIIIDRQDNQIKTTAISHLSALASMFLSGLTSETWFNVDGKNVRVVRGHDLDHKSGKIKRSFIIDQSQNQLLFDPGESKIIDSSEVFEAASFPVILMGSKIRSLEGKIIREVSAKRDRPYVYLAPEKENLEMHGKTYDTWKVTRHQVGDTSRQVTLWLDRDNQNVPIKIVTTRKEKDTVMTLLPDT